MAPIERGGKRSNRNRGRGKRLEKFTGVVNTVGGVEMKKTESDSSFSISKSDTAKSDDTEISKINTSFGSVEGFVDKSSISTHSPNPSSCGSRSQTSMSDVADELMHLSVHQARILNPVRLPARNQLASCVMDSPLPPAVPRGPVIRIKTNIYPMEVTDRIVYRYDVKVYGDGKNTDFCKGDRDDSEVTLRHRKCMLLMKLALQSYRLLSENGAYLYDTCYTLYTNEPLNKNLLPKLTITNDQLTSELKNLLGNLSAIGNVYIEISPCVESAHTFNVGNYLSSLTSDLAKQDRSICQFLEILTNNSALHRGTHFVFGRGKLFLVNGGNFNLEERRLSDARTLVTGVDKGIRFINRSKGSIVPALIIDVKKAAFFDSIPLKDMISKIVPNFDFNDRKVLDANSFQALVHQMSDVILGLRLQHINFPQKTFLAAGLTDQPVSQIRSDLPSSVTPRRSGDNKMFITEIYQRQGIKIRNDWPAVRLATDYNIAYYPIEVLQIAPQQRIPVSKQTPSQMKDAIKLCATPPSNRFQEIARSLQALDLDTSVHYNPFLSAFGVKISTVPITVDGHRRAAPKVRFSRGEITIDDRNANWRGTNKEYLVCAELRTWFVYYDDGKESEIVRAFVDVLMRESKKKGIKANNPVVGCLPFAKLEDQFKSIKQHCDRKARPFVIYIDSRPESHDELKLFEVLHGIITQHIHSDRARDAPRKIATLENIINKLNCKNFGQCYGVVPENFSANQWISTGKTLIIGYDVCHPEPQPKHERRMGIPPTQPSVLGISFNGAKCAETFIGDYSYQEPRKEQVTSSILEERMFWILKLFRMNRNTLPETIVITRDGVSEGQFRMVMEEEVEAIRQGIRNFAREELKRNDYVPKIVCIIACKRHNKRFVIQNGNSVENCLPLTVIDKDITRPDTTEFFMQSHKVIKGTGKLPAYSMPINEAKFTMDNVQSLMMALCYTHQIVNQAISIPEPIYQADEWAKRGRNNFKTMLRRVGGVNSLPLLKPKLIAKQKDEQKSVDWERVTKYLCYMHSSLVLTRANA